MHIQPTFTDASIPPLDSEVMSLSRVNHKWAGKQNSAYLEWNISSSTIEGKKSFNSENYYIEKQPYWDGIKIFWRRSENDVNISGVLSF